MGLPEDEDFEAAALDKVQRTIDIQAFVPQEEIDPIYFERTFFLAPRDGGEKVYALLARAMEETGLVAVATFVMRDREHLGLPARPRRRRSSSSGCTSPTRSGRPRASRRRACGSPKDELDMAVQLVEQAPGSSSPKRSRTRTATSS